MAKPAKKKWYTIAWFTREGQPHPGLRDRNFTKVYKTEKILLEDLSHGMSHFNPWGAYAVLIWEGQVSEWDAMNNQRPHFQVYENGDVHVVT